MQVRYRNPESRQRRAAEVYKCQVAARKPAAPSIGLGYGRTMCYQKLPEPGRMESELDFAHHRCSERLEFPASGCPSNKRNPFKMSTIVVMEFVLIAFLFTA